jgi:uncharacterized protein (TIGR02452 family)
MDKFNKQEKLACAAELHTMRMEKYYDVEILYSVKNSIIYDNFIKEQNKSNKNDDKPNIIITNRDTVSEIIYRYNLSKNKKIGALNFADFYSPGGGYIVGLDTQEESLCRYSYLYNVLTRFLDKFYLKNDMLCNNYLYSNRGIYSPKIIFNKNDEKGIADILTVAAPNYKAAILFNNISEEENTIALRSRIKFVLDIAKDNNIDVLILGAFGCGEFGNDPVIVSKIFKEYLNTYDFETVIFAIPPSQNSIVFYNTFS